MTSGIAPPPPPTAPHGWEVTTTTGDAGPFHQREMPGHDVGHLVWIHQVRRPALVLGSTQSTDLIDLDRAAADGVEVCRRRSGGGVVPLTPNAECWIDVIVPRTSALWSDDVGRAFAWLGQVWAATVTDLAPTAPAEVYAGPLLGGERGRLVCFASLGPGEVTVDGRKVVGISQRRTRTAARFQSVVVGRWRPDLLVRHLRPSFLDGVGIDLDRLAVGVGQRPWPSPSEVATAFCRRLPPVAAAASGAESAIVG